MQEFASLDQDQVIRILRFEFGRDAGDWISYAETDIDTLECADLVLLLFVVGRVYGSHSICLISF